MFKLIPYFKNYKKEFILGPACKLLEAILELILPTIMALIIDNGIANRDTGYIFRMGGLMLLMATIGLVSASVCQYYGSKVSQSVGTDLRNDLFSHISKLSYTQTDNFGTSSLTNRVTNDVNQIQLAVALLIRLVIRAPFICIGALAMAMILNFQLSLILLASVPVFALILYLIISKSTPIYKKYQKKLDRAGMIIRENMSGVRVIRAFSRGEKETQRFDSANDELYRTSVRVGKISQLLNPLTSLVLNLVIVVILWFGSISINNGSFLTGEMIAYIQYVIQLSLALVVVSNLVIVFTKASASSARIFEVLETESDIVSPEQAVHAESGGDISVQFKDVSFAYSSTGDNALENISFTAKKGEVIGVIGGTGSGKTTLVNLIPRFYDATAGEVLVNGVDVRKYELDALRQRIGIVPQKAVLFSGTIADNLRWGRQDATEAQMKRALDIAQASEFVSQTADGLESRVSRGGVNFSGGQKQRLTIARAIVREPDILILDDASSALDFATDSKLRKAIAEQTTGMTVFIVSQRAHVIRDADRIIVLSDGRIAGLGTHEELMQSCEDYQQICAYQLSGEEAAS
ncbi:ABC transporter ATP-binding protein [Candidatus Soleaferrea massiliensis]|uniref:ABC transporter ATP-binding protein n=1 Tax=Candidatus Soleaferrea massiliensis TaxID=1470354 RepID=UPI00058AC14E|nr:ABC transporter ATP-binding protein [Candidatus Soleaferrea massiliensis]